MRKKQTYETSHQKIAALMISSQISFRNAISELEIPLSSDDAVRIEHSRAFKRVFLAEQNKYYQEISDDPTSTKASLIGEMLYCARQLIKEGLYDKALEGLFKVARTRGIVGGETNISVFGDLTAKDILAAKEKLAEMEKSARPVLAQ